MRVLLPTSALVAAALVPLALAPAPAGAQARDPNLVRAERVLRSTPLVDGHNDLPWRIREDTLHPGDVQAYDLRRATPGMTDLERLRKGRVGAQFWSVYLPGDPREDAFAPNGRVSGTPGYARVQLEQIDIARRIVETYPDRFAWALTPADIRRVFRQGKVGSLLGMEGGHAIENSLGALRAFYDMGARYMTLTHNVTTDWADAATDSARHGGLTPFGEEVVREMNRLGMLVDLSHVSPATMSDALRVTQAPVIFSHSSARGVTDHPRNVPDSILVRLKQNGGVVMVTFVPTFVSQEVASHAAERDRFVAGLRQRFPGDMAAARRELETWRAALAVPNVIGMVVGRSLLYPPDDDVAGAVDRAVGLLPGRVGAP